jgi:hypothetical protein
MRLVNFKFALFFINDTSCRGTVLAPVRVEGVVFVTNSFVVDALVGVHSHTSSCVFNWVELHSEVIEIGGNSRRVEDLHFLMNMIVEEMT